jgi:tetratricopeptide (TPR) repeat protein
MDKDSPSTPLKKAFELIEAKKPIDAIRVLSDFYPRKASLSSYHYAYAKAYSQIGKISESMEHFRLAYLYSTEEREKEQILFERAETYLTNRYYNEAAVCFRIFIKQYQGSKLQEQAFLGLAESLYNINRLNDAFGFFQKGGNSFRALYGKADTLHTMGRVNEAHEIYLHLVNRDRGYEKSQLTLYNIGENFRLMNKFSFAKIYLALVKELPLKYKADLSSGLIAFAEGQMDSAMKYFEVAVQSPDRSIKQKALLHMSEIFMKSGKQKEAKARLLEIRNRYPYGKDYDEAVLRLSGILKSEGNLSDAVSILRELVFRKTPDKKALNEFESLLLEARNRNNDEFMKLWKTVGQWMLEPSRSEFIVTIVRDLKPAGKPYLDVCKWLAKYGSGDAKMYGNLLLAEFYAEMGDMTASSKYFQNVKIAGRSDYLKRIHGRLFYLRGEMEKALSEIGQINELKEEDLSLFIDISAQMSPSIKNHQNLANFLENAIKKFDDKAKFSIHLADTLYQLGKGQDALKYYKAAISVHEKHKGLTGKDLDWCLYRISTLSGRQEAEEAFKSLQKGDDKVNRFAGTKLRENSIDERIKRLF